VGLQAKWEAIGLVNSAANSLFAPMARPAGRFVPVLLAVLFFIPPEISAKVLGIVIMPYRIALLVLIGPALARLWAHRGPALYDIIIGVYIVPVFASMIYNHGVDGVFSGGLAALETSGAYFIARAYIGSTRAFRAFAETWIAMALLVLPFLLAESVLHHDLIHPFARALMGGQTGVDIANAHPTLASRQERFGLYRVSGPFAHPILCGVAYAMLLPYVLLLYRGFKRTFCAAALALGIALTVSTDPILILVVELASCFGLYWSATRPWRSPLPNILLAGVPLWIVLNAIASRPLFTVLATRLAFDSWTGYYRTLIWQYGLASVAAHPLFGIGYHDWVRPLWMVAPSIDSYWLLIAMRHGVFAVTLLAAAYLVALAKLLSAYGNLAWQKPGLRTIGAICFSVLLGLTISGLTVDYWGATAMIVPIFAGIAVNILKAQEAAAHQQGAVVDRSVAQAGGAIAA
jgi:hypothetical protein